MELDGVACEVAAFSGGSPNGVEACLRWELTIGALLAGFGAAGLLRSAHRGVLGAVQQAGEASGSSGLPRDEPLPPCIRPGTSRHGAVVGTATRGSRPRASPALTLGKASCAQSE